MANSFKRAVVAVALLVLGCALQAVSRTPPVELTPVALIKLTRDGQIDQSYLQARLNFAKERQVYIAALEPPYSDHRAAFLAARSEDDYPKIKEAIDGELDAKAAIERPGLGAVPGLTGDALTRISLWLIGLAAAVAFHSFAFVLGAAFAAGAVYGFADELHTLTGLTSEQYLATILATLIVAVAAWFVMQRAWRPPPA